MMHIKTLVLCSTEHEEALQPITTFTTRGISPVTIETSTLEPGFQTTLSQGKKSAVAYRTFSIIPAFVWQKKVIQFFREDFSKILKCDNILVDASHDEAAKVFCELVLKFSDSKKVALILSNKTQKILEKCDPHYYSVIKSCFILEDEFNANKERAEQTRDQSLANRLFWVAKNLNFTDLERRVYWYFYAKTLKADSIQNLDHLKLYYDDVVRDFMATLHRVQPKDIYKTIDSLKKKRLLQIKHVDGRKIFVLTINGPVDMLTGRL